MCDVLEKLSVIGKTNPECGAVIEKQLKADREFLSHYVSNMEKDENAAHAILDILDSIESPTLEDTAGMFKTKKSLKALPAYIREKLGAIVHKNSPRRKLQRQKFPGLTHGELRSDIEHFARTIGIPADSVKATKLDDNLYHLSRI